MSDLIVTFDEAAVRGELRELVRQTVEDTSNALLEEEEAMIEMYLSGVSTRRVEDTSEILWGAVPSRFFRTLGHPHDSIGMITRQAA